MKVEIWKHHIYVNSIWNAIWNASLVRVVVSFFFFFFSSLLRVPLFNPAIVTRFPMTIVLFSEGDPQCIIQNLTCHTSDRPLATSITILASSLNTVQCRVAIERVIANKKRNWYDWPTTAIAYACIKGFGVVVQPHISNSAIGSPRLPIPSLDLRILRYGRCHACLYKISSSASLRTYVIYAKFPCNHQVSFCHKLICSVTFCVYKGS